MSEDAYRAIEPSESPAKLEKEIRSLLQLGRGNALSITWVLYGLIESSPHSDRARLLAIAADIFGRLDRDESRSRIAVTDPPGDILANQASLRRRYADLVDAALTSYIDRNASAEEFYESMWTFIESSILEDKNAKVFALYWMMLDRRIPYYQIDPGLRMDPGVFRDRTLSLRDPIGKLRFLLARDFEQRTELAGAVLTHIEAFDDRVDRIVLVSQLIGEMQRMLKDNDGPASSD